MKCKHCGAEIANDSVFCEYCGKRLKCHGGLLSYVLHS